MRKGTYWRLRKEAERLDEASLALVFARCFPAHPLSRAIAEASHAERAPR